MSTKTNFAKIAAAVAIAFLATSASAQQSPSQNVSTTATIVAPITITKDADLSFGKFSVGSGGGTVILAATTGSNGRTTTGEITLPADAGTVNAAKFTIGGANSYAFSVTLSNTPVTLSHSSTSDELEVNNFVVRNAAGNLAPFALSGLGAETIYVGATLTADGNDDPGNYTSDADFTVTVNYN